MKIEKNYYNEHEKFEQCYDIFQINWHQDEPDFLCKGSYTNLEEALKYFYKLCKKDKETHFRLEPCNVYWYQDVIGWTYNLELNTSFELGNDDIYICNYYKGWESHIKKLLKRKQ